MVKITNIFGDRYSGQAGKAGVFATWKGIQYRRAYVKPSNPNTTKQQAVRNSLSAAIDRWHEYVSVMRQAYSYMAAGLRMSGFNLFCSRWQKEIPNSDANMIEPPIGIKCLGHTKTARTNTSPLPTNHAFSLTYKPVVIGTIEFTPSGGDEEMDAYVEKQQGFIRLLSSIIKADGAKGTGATLEAGDQLVISYKASGRIITREVLYTIPAEETDIPATSSMEDALATVFSPIDWGTVVIETHDLNGGANEWTQLESMECDSVLGKVFYDLSDAAQAGSSIGYDSYTPLADAKLEMTKSDTSFIAWRNYSDANGQLPIAATVEDETYDLVVTLTGHTPVTETAKTALLAALTEFIDLGA